MDIVELKAVLDVCRFKNYAEAAHYASVAPSVISKYIAKVESELGITLFERATKSKPVELTPAGRLVINDIKNTLESYSDLMNSARSARPDALPSIAMGYSPSIGTFEESTIVAGFLYKNSDISMYLASGSPAELLDRLLAGTADALLMTLCEWDLQEQSAILARLHSPEIELIEMRRTRSLYFMINKGHALATREFITAEDLPALESSTFILNSQSTYMADEKNAEKCAGLIPGLRNAKHLSVDFSKASIVMSMLKHTDAVVPLCCIRPRYMQNCVSVPFADWNVTTYQYFAYKKNNPSRSLRKFKRAVMDAITSENFEY